MNSTNAELINDVLSLVLEIIYISASIVMIGVAGIASGLTLSFFAQDVTRLEILQRVSPSSTIRARVSIILRLLQHRHRLLITLIVTNMIMTETLPVLLDQVVPPYVSVILSVTAIVFFGEILPQAICAKYNFVIAGICGWPMQFLVWLLFPINYPISLILDCMLGSNHEGVTYNKEEMVHFVKTNTTLENKQDFLEYAVQFSQCHIIEFIIDEKSMSGMVCHTAYRDEYVFATILRVQAELIPGVKDARIAIKNPDNYEEIIGYTTLGHIYSCFNPFGANEGNSEIQVSGQCE